MPERLLYGGIFEVDVKKERLQEILQELEQPTIWQQPDKAQALGKERVKLESVTQSIDKIQKNLLEMQEFLMLAESENDQVLLADLTKDISSLTEDIATLEFHRMFSKPLDANNAYVDIQSGSGGTEAQDWAEMLLRMYLRWGDKHGLKTELIQVSPGEVAGIKSATIYFEGSYSYGWLRTESGVHRLVRKSPFDSGNRRHTSFASVFVSPEIDDDFAIDINPTDLRIDTYRARGAGGQHVNTTDSAIRITHIPTGIVVQCQSDRSQHKNRAQAFKQLRSKLYELELQQKSAEKKALEDNKSDITWGSQIRSYILDDSRIKDLRTGIETTSPQKIQAILDGDLDFFMEASLKEDIS
jgi:peptide chain release factor 2